MNAGRFANWLQVAGNFGLIAGLVLVAIQINQNTDIARAQLVSESYRAEMEVPLVLMGEHPARSWSRAIYAPEELTDEDLVVLDAMLLKGWLNLSRIEYLVDLGYAGGVEGPAQSFAWDYLNHGFGTSWWETRSEWIVAPASRAREVIERELARPDAATRRPPPLPERYNRLRAPTDLPLAP